MFRVVTKLYIYTNSYTYHDRIVNYELCDADCIKAGFTYPYDQLNYVLKKLAEAPHTRRAQAVTWRVDTDTLVEDPACLQRLWFRVYGDTLRLNVHMRSNDAFKAAFMNMFAFIGWQEEVAARLSNKLGREIKVGTYTHIADSFHIYGKYFNEFVTFLNYMERKPKDRYFDSTDFKEILAEGWAKGLEPAEPQVKAVYSRFGCWDEYIKSLKSCNTRD